MKTHELSKALMALAKVLKAGPDVDIDTWSVLGSVTGGASSKNQKVKDGDIPAALYTLVSLNNVSKAQWISFISEYGIDVEIRPRDANRDIVGKVLSYLAANPLARDSLLKNSSKRTPGHSAELANAFNILLK